MAWAVIDEAIRNAVVTGADPEHIAILDNFCWGDPNRPETMGTLVEAARGCHDAAIEYGTPFISGKDSLNNEYLGADGQRHAIAPTLLISALGLINDVNQAISMDLKKAGNLIYLAGDFQPTLGGSHLALVMGGGTTEEIPAPSKIAPRVYRAFHHAVNAGLVRSAHDLSEGGLAVAATEMCIGGRLGMDLTANSWFDQALHSLFGETNGCFLAEVTPGDMEDFEFHFSGLPLIKIGQVTSTPTLRIAGVEILVDELLAAFKTPA